MRTENEMMKLIIGVAENDERIRAVYMNGSRTNPNIKKDVFQDYDIVYVVKETLSFINDKKWTSLFGEIAIMQLPDDNDNAWGLTMISAVLMHGLCFSRTVTVLI